MKEKGTAAHVVQSLDSIACKYSLLTCHDFLEITVIDCVDYNISCNLIGRRSPTLR